MGERKVVADDIIPLRFPVKTADGRLIDSIRVTKGQVGSQS